MLPKEKLTRSVRCSDILSKFVGLGATWDWCTRPHEHRRWHCSFRINFKSRIFTIVRNFWEYLNNRSSILMLFYYLAPLQKWLHRDVIKNAVHFWGQERGLLQQTRRYKFVWWTCTKGQKWKIENAAPFVCIVFLSIFILLTRAPLLSIHSLKYQS